MTCPHTNRTTTINSTKCDDCGYVFPEQGREEGILEFYVQDEDKNFIKLEEK